MKNMLTNIGILTALLTVPALLLSDVATSVSIEPVNGNQFKNCPATFHIVELGSGDTVRSYSTGALKKKHERLILHNLPMGNTYTLLSYIDANRNGQIDVPGSDRMWVDTLFLQENTGRVVIDCSRPSNNSPSTTSTVSARTIILTVTGLPPNKDLALIGRFASSSLLNHEVEYARRQGQSSKRSSITVPIKFLTSPVDGQEVFFELFWDKNGNEEVDENELPFSYEKAFIYSSELDSISFRVDDMYQNRRRW